MYMNFFFQVHSADVFGGLLLQSASVQDYDQRDMFCLFLIPGNNKKRKVRLTLISYQVLFNDGLVKLGTLYFGGRSTLAIEKKKITNKKL